MTHPQPSDAEIVAEVDAYTRLEAIVEDAFKGVTPDSVRHGPIVEVRQTRFVTPDGKEHLKLNHAHEHLRETRLATALGRAGVQNYAVLAVVLCRLVRGDRDEIARLLTCAGSEI